MFEVTGQRRGQLGPESVIAGGHRLVVAAEMTEIEGREVQVVLGLNSAITEETLTGHLPGQVSERVEARYEASLRRVMAESRRSFRDLMLETRQAGEPPEEKPPSCSRNRWPRGI